MRLPPMPKKMPDANEAFLSTPCAIHTATGFGLLCRPRKIERQTIRQRPRPPPHPRNDRVKLGRVSRLRSNNAAATRRIAGRVRLGEVGAALLWRSCIAQQQRRVAFHVVDDCCRPVSSPVASSSHGSKQHRSDRLKIALADEQTHAEHSRHLRRRCSSAPHQWALCPRA